MNKKEFLDGLREQLTGQMTEGKIQSHVRYYQEYIEIQMKNGKSEAEAVESLGIPQLIAKTLIDTDAADDQENGRYDTNSYEQYQSDHNTATYYEEDNRYEANEYDVTYGDDFSSTHRQENDVYGRNEYAYGSNGYVKHRTWHIDLNAWYGKLLVIAIAILIIAALIFVIGTIVPILLVAFLIVSAISYLKRRKR